MLNYEVYYSNRFWWFRMVEVDRFGAPITTLYRRRFHSSDEATRCAEQALEHERSKREAYRQSLEAVAVEN